MARAALRWDREEMEAITVIIDSSVSRRVSGEEVQHRLKSWSGVDDVRIRHKVCNKFLVGIFLLLVLFYFQKLRNDTNECFVTAAGTLESRQALHDILLSDNLLDCLVNNINPLLDPDF